MATIADRRGAETWQWDTGLLDWVRGKQPVISTDNINATIQSPLSVTGTFWQATQPVSAASLPLPSGAATQTTLAAIDTSTAKVKLTAASGSVLGIGNNTLITPAAGKKLRISYLSYNPILAVECAFRFGAAGALFLRNNLTTAGAVIAKDMGDLRYLEGAVDEPLILNLSLAVATIWNAFYVEV